MKCKCGNAFECPNCHECYPCQHEVVLGVWEDIHVGWRCPDGYVHPAYGPGREE